MLEDSVSTSCVRSASRATPGRSTRAPGGPPRARGRQTVGRPAESTASRAGSHRRSTEVAASACRLSPGPVGCRRRRVDAEDDHALAAPAPAEWSGCVAQISGRSAGDVHALELAVGEKRQMPAVRRPEGRDRVLRARQLAGRHRVERPHPDRSACRPCPWRAWRSCARWARSRAGRRRCAAGRATSETPAGSVNGNDVGSSWSGAGCSRRVMPYIAAAPATTATARDDRP